MDAFLQCYVIFKNTNSPPRESSGVCFPVVPGEAAAASALPGDTEAALCEQGAAVTRPWAGLLLLDFGLDPHPSPWQDLPW